MTRIVRGLWARTSEDKLLKTARSHSPSSESTIQLRDNKGTNSLARPKDPKGAFPTIAELCGVIVI